MPSAIAPQLKSANPSASRHRLRARQCDRCQNVFGNQSSSKLGSRPAQRLPLVVEQR